MLKVIYYADFIAWVLNVSANNMNHITPTEDSTAVIVVDREIL